MYDIVITTAFGLESVVKKELNNLGYKDFDLNNGKIELKGNQRDIVKLNLWLRTADRIYIKLLKFKALSYDDIYDNMNAFDWENFLSSKGKYIILGKSYKSKMYSISDNQSVGKKAIVDRLKKVYNIDWFEENKEEYKISININEDIATVLLDTSGSGLHKRGYRIKQNEAPIKETLAAAMVLLSNWDGNRPFVDLCCGSGTIPIEAALIAKNIASGISRDFDFIHWEFMDKNIYREEKKKAYNQINDKKIEIYGFDIDRNSIDIAKENAIEAGVEDCIRFYTKDMAEVRLKNNFGIVVSNPPYGERIGDNKQLEKIYSVFKKLQNILTTWSFFYVTKDKDLEKKLNLRSTKKRKLYNGRIEVHYYQYFGPEPLF